MILALASLTAALAGAPPASDSLANTIQFGKEGTVFDYVGKTGFFGAEAGPPTCAPGGET